MPELPEVQTVLNTLKGLIKNRKIIDVEVLYPNIIVGDSQEFKKRVVNQHFRHFNRRGKYLLFELDDVVLVSHLRMEGKYFFKDESESTNKHTHIIFHLDDNKKLEYNDTRKFGRMELYEKDYDFKGLKNLGPEPFSDEFSLPYVKKYLSNEKRPIKEILLDQSFVAGVGNIYADEIIFNTLIHPETKGKYLDEDTITRLIDCTRNILAAAIEMGGTTIRSYTSSLGVTGRFQLSLSVHQKEGEPCPICRNEIKKIKVGGRGTYYCPNCQKKTRRIGITGNIAGGKSTTLAYLNDLGYPTFSADEEVRRLYKKGNKGYLFIKDEYPEVFDGDILNRNKLAALLFNDKDVKKNIESKIHPLVLDAYLKQSINNDIIFAEIPLLFESVFDKYFDEVLLVYSTDNIIFDRLVLKGYSIDEAKRRMNSQMSIEDKISKADYVIENNKTIKELYDKIEVWIKDRYVG